MITTSSTSLTSDTVHLEILLQYIYMQEVGLEGLTNDLSTKVDPVVAYAEHSLIV